MGSSPMDLDDRNYSGTISQETTLPTLGDSDLLFNARAVSTSYTLALSWERASSRPARERAPSSRLPAHPSIASVKLNGKFETFTRFQCPTSPSRKVPAPPFRQFYLAHSRATGRLIPGRPRCVMRCSKCGIDNRDGAPAILDERSSLTPRNGHPNAFGSIARRAPQDPQSACFMAIWKCSSPTSSNRWRCAASTR